MGFSLEEFVRFTHRFDGFVDEVLAGRGDYGAETGKGVGRRLIYRLRNSFAEGKLLRESDAKDLSFNLNAKGYPLILLLSIARLRPHEPWVQKTNNCAGCEFADG